MQVKEQQHKGFDGSAVIEMDLFEHHNLIYFKLGVIVVVIFEYNFWFVCARWKF